MYEYYTNNQEDTIRAQAVPNPPRKDKRGMGFFGKVGTGLCVGLAFGVVAGASFAGVTRAIDHFFPVKEEAVSNQEDVETNETHEDKKAALDKAVDGQINKQANAIATGMDVSAIVEEAMPSVVSITNKSVQEVMSMWGMGIQQYESTSAGSGIIVGENDDELLIATNNHVIANAKDLSVGFVDDEIYSAYVKGYDEDLDLAVVAVKTSDLSEDTKDAIKVAKINDSDNLKVGEQVIAIGNALGYGQSVTTGIVSALNRELERENVSSSFIQTDAAINPGNSGGALLNMKGELIGINSAKIASTTIEGVGYAIPMTEAVPIIEALMNRENREEVDAKEAGYVGISGVSVDSQSSSMYGIPIGVYIQTVEEGSPADKAGLIKSDVVRKFDGITVSSINDIRERLSYYKAGETIDLVIYRLIDGEYVEKTVPITLGDRKGTVLDPDNDNNPDEEVDANADAKKEQSQDDNSGKKSNGRDLREEIFDIFGY